MRLAALVAPAVLLVALLLYVVRDVLSPLVVFALLWAVLWPERRNPHVARLLAAASALIAVWLLWAAGTLLAPFVLGLALAYLLAPAVAWLDRHRVPRWLGSLLVVLPFIAALVVLIALLVPALQRQVVQGAQQLPVLLGRLADWLERLRTSFLASNQGLLTEAQAAKLRGLQASDLVAMVQARWQDIARAVWGGILGIGKGVSLALTIVGFAVVTPVVTFNLLNTWTRITAWVEGLVPPARRAEVLGFLRQYDAQLGRYVRGQLTEALLVGTLVGVGLGALGFPGPLLMAVAAGLGNLVPYIGLPLGILPGVVLALTSGAIGTSLLTRSKMVGRTCATPGTASSFGVSSSTAFSMPWSDVPSGVSITSWNSPMSSFGRNERPTMRLNTNVDAKVSTLTATMRARWSSAHSSDRR